MFSAVRSFYCVQALPPYQGLYTSYCAAVLYRLWYFETICLENKRSSKSRDFQDIFQQPECRIIVGAVSLRRESCEKDASSSNSGKSNGSSI